MISQGEGTVDQLLKLLKLDNYAFYSFTCCKLQVLTGELLSSIVCFCLRFAPKMRKISGDQIQSCLRNNSIPL